MFKKAFILVLILSMLLTACGSVAPEKPAAEPTKAEQPAVEPTKAEQPAVEPTKAEPTAEPTKAPEPAAAEPTYLTVNLEQQATWVRNFNLFSPDARQQALAIIYEPMLVFNQAAGELVPWLATEYAWNEDYTVLTFKLRQGVKWSDGQPFSAKDVIFTFDLVKKNPSLYNNLGTILTDYVDSYSAPDDFTVEFKFKTVYTPALHPLANQLVVPEHVWKDIADPATFTNENPVGTGPFTEITKFEDQIYIIEKNPHYWQEGKPAFQGLRFPAYPGNDQANLALANGELDWAGNFVPDIENTFVAKDPENFHYYFVGGDTIMLYLNPTLKPFDNPEVRKAISMGIDRKMIVNVAMFDYIPPSDATGLSDQYKSWKNPQAVEAGAWTNYDVEKANEMLDAAGLKKGDDGLRVGPDGKPMEYTLLVVNGWTDWISACQIMAQNMKDLGITVNIETPEFNAWQNVVFRGQYQWTIGWSSGGPTPFNFYRGQMSQSTVLPVGETASENWNRYASVEADKLLEEFSKTGDAAKQTEAMNALQMVFVNEAPALPLFPGPNWYEYVTTRFTGFPTQDDPYAPGSPYAVPVLYPSPLLVVTQIQPK